MALNFDLGNPPPTLAEITAEHQRADRERDAIQKKLIPFLIGAFVAIVALVTFQITIIVPAVRNPETSPTFLAIVALFIPYMAFILFFIANHLRHKIIENPRKALKAYMASLEAITPEEQAQLAAAIDAGELPGEVAAYQRKVAALGRPIVRGEIDAIKALERRRMQHRDPASPAR
jgi:hypothetical protein